MDRALAGTKRISNVLHAPGWQVEQIEGWLRQQGDQIVEASLHPRDMVVSRPGAGRQPWFLLTSDPVSPLEDAWRIVFGHNRRWQVETSIRFDKSELAIESIRLLDWDARKKMMLIVALVHALLLSFFAPAHGLLRAWLLDTRCHRTGQWSRPAAAPLYRLRLALSALWLAFWPASLPRLI